TFYQVVNLSSSEVVRDRIGALDEDRWAVITVSGSDDSRIKQTTFFDEQYVARGTIREKSNYFPTQRPWYRVSESEKVNKTEPYLFQ
ncbi:hypothetical protein ACPV5V_30295, partial [Vibrio campbellii]